VFALGIAAIIQAGLLPGYLFLRLLGLNEGLLRMVALAIPLSLLLNHLLVFGLVALGIFTPAILYTVFAAEFAVLLGLFLRDRHRVAWPPGSSDAKRLRSMCDYLNGRSTLACITGNMGIAAAALTLILCIWMAFANFGTIFDRWDAVVSWNRWALDWYAGRLPFRTWNYPQLLPTTYALTYTFLQTSEIQFFARASTSLFPIAMLLAMLDMGLRLRDSRILLAVPLAFYLTICIAEGSMTGYADEPVAALTLIAVYCILIAGNAPTAGEARRLLAIGAMVAAAAALTKQAGWLIAAVYPVLAWIYVLRQPGVSRRTQILRAVMLMGIILALVGPWNIYLRLSNATSEFDFILNIIHGERTYLERAAWGSKLLARRIEAPPWVVHYLMPALILASLFDRRWRWVSLLVVIPLTVVWAMYISYTQRNLAGVVPLGAISLVAGAGVLLSAAGNLRRLPGLRPWMVYAGAGALAAGAAVWLSAGIYRYSGMLYRQHEQQWQIGQPSTNQLLREYYADPGFETSIVTNYQILNYLPEINHLFVFDHLNSSPHIASALERSSSRYILYHGQRQPPEAIQRLVAAGDFVMVRRGPYARLYKAREQEQ
jgi:hypothetical protein